MTDEKNHLLPLAAEQGQVQGIPPRHARGGGTWLATLRRLLVLLPLCALFLLSISSADEKHDLLEPLWLALIRHATPVQHLGLASARDSCPQVAPYPDSIGSNIPLPSQSTLAKRLSEAVQINTSVGDGWPSPADDPERWAPLFTPFREWLARTFPRLHDQQGPVKLEIVNSHGLLYTWQGSDSSRKPLLLMAHQDVVPVNPEVFKDWRHPPFDGVIDENQVVWGRGSYDAKSWLVSIVSTLEALIEAGHKPSRTVLVSFGFDEEASGHQGAVHLAEVLRERYGNDSIALILDEGTPVLGPADPANLLRKPLALASVAEKGALHTSVTVHTRGGHSSLPDEHTSITLLARLLTALEDDPYFNAVITGAKDDMAYQQLRCFVDAPVFPPDVKARMQDLEWALRHADGPGRGGRGDDGRRRKHPRHGELSHKTKSPRRFHFCPHKLRRFTSLLSSSLASALDSPSRSARRIARARAALQVAISRYPLLRNPAETTRSANIIRGGLKINALPEQAQAFVDHRISTLSSLKEVKGAYRRLSHLANSLGLDADIFGEKFAIGGASIGNDSATAAALTPWALTSTAAQLATQKVGTVVIESMNGEDGVEPAPTTPIAGKGTGRGLKGGDDEEMDAKPWELVSGLIRRVWQEQAREVTGDDKAEIRVVPAIMQGNTDTRRFWALTRHIFRFGPGSLQKDPTGLGVTTGIHTTNEHYNSDGLVRNTEFYRALIIALEERTDL